MLTIKIKLKESIHSEKIKDLQTRYSYAFRKLYNNSLYIDDSSYRKSVEVKYGLNSYFMNSILSEISTKTKQIQTNKTQTEEKIVSATKQLESLRSQKNKTWKEKQKEFKLHKKLAALNRSLPKNIVFGGKNLLQKISRLSNKISEKPELQEKLDNARQEYKSNRVLPICMIGQSHFCGNVFFRIQDDGTILFKPSKKLHINLELCASKKINKLLERLKHQADNQLQPLTFKLSTDYVWITYDEQVLNNFHQDTKQLKEDLKKFPKCKENEDIRKHIYRDSFAEQKSRKLKGKIANRYISVDLNPKFIGYSICDYIDNQQVVIDKGCFDLSNLSASLRLSSKDPKQVYQNNKRKYEIVQVMKQIFKIASHYKCGHFAIEDLNFKAPIVNTENREFNKQTKNMWHLGIIMNQITKRTNETGIILVEVNPVYTSFIGNLTNMYYDPVSASLEINRRGYFKYVKGNNFYPEFNLETALDTMSSINQMVDVRDVLKIEGLMSNSSMDLSWPAFYKLVKKTGLQYRRCLENHKQFSLNNRKSRTVLYSF